jgi:hypothetical protein
MSLVLTTSCIKKFLDDYLNKAPEQGLTDDIVFTKLTNFKLFFDAVYSGTKYWSGSSSWQNYNIRCASFMYWNWWDQKYMTEVTTDALDQGRYMEGHAWKSGQMSETIVNKLTYDGARRPILESMFTDIRISNIALKNVSRIQDATDADKDDIRAQAYFVRAYCHFMLFKLWGPMPYITNVIGPTDQWDIARLTAHETCVKIAQDFDTAYTYFVKAGTVRRDPVSGAGHNDYNAYQLYRPNGMAALAQESKALLYAASPENGGAVADWQTAAKISWDAIQVAKANGIVLLPLTGSAGRSQCFYGTMLCDEVIWSWCPGTKSWNDGGGANNFASWFNGPFLANTANTSGACPSQNWVDKYETIWGDPLNTDADRVAATALGHYNEQNPFASRDPRLDEDVIHNQSANVIGWGQVFATNAAQHTLNRAEIWRKGAVNSELLNSANAGITQTGYYMRKWWANNSTNNQIAATYWTDPLNRLAELYLNYAEASNEAYGPTTIGVAGATLTAVDAINVIRTRAGMPNVQAVFTGTADAFRPRIKNERDVELSLEGGNYYCDIRRWNDLQGVMSNTMIGMIAEKQAAITPTYPTGYQYVRRPLSADRQPMWKPQMYYLPFNNADKLKMKNFVANPVW